MATGPRWEGPPVEAWAGAWRPQEAARRLAGCGAAWCVAGGWALDLFLGRQTRPHGDLEIALPAAELGLVLDRLHGFELFTVGDGEVVRRQADQPLPPDRHQTWVMDPAAQAWRMDVFAEPGDAARWVFRRDEALSAPRSQMMAIADGVPFLQPAAVLLYKAKALRSKDQQDFDTVLPALDAAARAWLAGALRRMHPGHAWLARL